MKYLLTTLIVLNLNSTAFAEPVSQDLKDRVNSELSTSAYCHKTDDCFKHFKASVPLYGELVEANGKCTENCEKIEKVVTLMSEHVHYYKTQLETWQAKDAHEAEVLSDVDAWEMAASVWICQESMPDKDIEARKREQTLIEKESGVIDLAERRSIGEAVAAHKNRIAVAKTFLVKKHMKALPCKNVIEADGSLKDLPANVTEILSNPDVFFNVE